MPIDTAFIGALRVEYLGRGDARARERAHHVLFQASTIDALLNGNYDGDVSFAELRTRGDFGIGTVDALDGEVVGLDGTFYQVRADGRAYEVDGRAKTPFAVVTFFEPTLSRSLDVREDLAALCASLDQIVGGGDVLCAVRLDGRFGYVKTRSVPRQRRPYPPLAEVVKRQPTFEFRDVQGSLVGFRFPDYARGLNVPGYHFHFITDARTAGGHVLECRLAWGELRVDREADLRLELPPEVSLPVPGQAASDDDALNRVERGQ